MKNEFALLKKFFDWKKSILTGCFAVLVYALSAQNYFQSNPIAASVVFNGSQSRLECSVFDSTLQSFQYYNSPWFNDTVQIIDNNFGMVAFNSWTSQIDYTDSIYGFLIYDHIVSQFKPELKIFNPSVKYAAYPSLNMWGVTLQIQNGYFGNDTIRKYDYRYDIITHEWKELFYYVGIENNLQLEGITTTGVRWIVKGTDQGEFWIYDPVSHGFLGGQSGCMMNYYYEDDYAFLEEGCESVYTSYCFNPLLGTYASFYGNGPGYVAVDNGMFFTAYEDFSTLEINEYFFTFDQSMQDFVVDTMTYVNNQGFLRKNRLIAYKDTSINPDRIYFKTYSITSHAWITDSADADGITNFSIDEGTVTWNDLTGLHSKGYIEGAGWGNTSAPVQLLFDLTDLSATTGQTLIHVRDYSIGTDTVIYDFGDGVTSINNAKVLWHYYKEPGNYTICMTDASGILSNCQQIAFTICSVAGNATASADSICMGDSATLNVAGYVGAVQWQSANVTSFNWINETGPGANTDTYKVSPQFDRKYRAKVTDSTCVPAFTSDIIVYVSGLTVVGTAIATPDTICSGTTTKLTTGSIWADTWQWQSFDGMNWADETGAGSNTKNYYVSPGIATTYRLIAQLGVCPADTSNIVAVSIDSFPQPVTVNDTICSGGVVNLTASGSGVIDWYEFPGSAISLNTGSVYAPIINTTTDFYVQAKSGVISNAGPVDTLIGNTVIDSTSNLGLRFSSNANAILDWVHIFPATGVSTVTIKLFNRQTGLVLDSVTQSISGTGKAAVYCGFDLSAGWVYDLKLFGSASLVSNSSGAIYPMTMPGSPVTILGYYNPYFETGTKFLYFYDWQITEGCRSNFVQVKGVVGQISPPEITPAGPLAFCQGDSVELFASLVAGGSYQWYLNGNSLSGETMQSYTAHSPGNYSVAVSLDTCQATSVSQRVSIPCIYEFIPGEKSDKSENGCSLLIRFDQETKTVYLSANGLLSQRVTFELFDDTGRLVFKSNEGNSLAGIDNKIDVSYLHPGIYSVRFVSGNCRKVERIALID